MNRRWLKIFVTNIFLVVLSVGALGQTLVADSSTFSSPHNINITIDTNPSNLSISHNGVVYHTPWTFSWPELTTQTVVAISPQAYAGKVDTMFQFKNWDDGSESKSLQIRVGEQAQKFVAQYERFFRLSSKIDPPTAGTVEVGPIDDRDNFEFGQYLYIRSGAEVTLTAMPYLEYVFAGWENTLPGDVIHDQTITIQMSEPRAIKAVFSLLPTTPSALHARAVSESSIELTWLDTDYESGYGILRSIGAEGNWVAIDSVAQGVTTYLDSGLVPGKSYYYKIWAFNSVGNSDTTEAVWVVPEGEVPYVTEWWPSTGAKDVDTTNVTIWMRFSRAMDIISTQRAFSITPEVEGIFLWEELNRKMNFIPSGPLTGNDALYEIALDTTALDLQGNFLIQAVSWNFRTHKPPRIQSVFPAPDSSNVNLRPTIVVTFDEKMQPATVETAFNLIDVMRDSLIDVSMDTTELGSRQFTFTPMAPLTPETRYRARVSTAAADSAGIFLQLEFVWEFISADITGPTVVDWSPAEEDTVDVPVSIWAEFTEPVDSATVTPATFAVKQNGVPTDGTVTVSGTRISFSPLVEFSPLDSVFVAVQNTEEDSIRDLSGNAMTSGFSWWFWISGVTGKALTRIINFPNPFHPTTGPTTIVINFNRRTTYSVNIYDVAGRVVRELVRNENSPGGRVATDWDGKDFAGRNLAQGVYICEVVAKAEKGPEERRYRNIAIFLQR